MSPTPNIHKWLFTRDCSSFSPLHRRHFRQTDFWTSAWRLSCTVEDSMYWISTPAFHHLPQPPLDSGSPRRHQSQPKDFWLLPWPAALASFTSLDVCSSGKTKQFLYRMPSRMSLVHRYEGDTKNVLHFRYFIVYSLLSFLFFCLQYWEICLTCSFVVNQINIMCGATKERTNIDPCTFLLGMPARTTSNEEDQ